MKLVCLFIQFELFLLGTTDGYKVLGILPFGSKSHFAVGHAIVESLLKAGNEVTVISPYPKKKPLANYTDIDMSPFLENFKKGFIICKKSFVV